MRATRLAPIVRISQFAATVKWGAFSLETAWTLWLSIPIIELACWRTGNGLALLAALIGTLNLFALYRQGWSKRRIARNLRFDRGAVRRRLRECRHASGPPNSQTSKPPTPIEVRTGFLHHAEIVTVTGKSYRLKDKAEKTEKSSKSEKSEKACNDEPKQ